MMSSEELKRLFAVDAESRRCERDRVVALFASLADQIDEKASSEDGDAGLAWTAAASAIRRVCREASE